MKSEEEILRTVRRFLKQERAATAARLEKFLEREEYLKVCSRLATIDEIETRVSNTVRDANQPFDDLE